MSDDTIACLMTQLQRAQEAAREAGQAARQMYQAGGLAQQGAADSSQQTGAQPADHSRGSGMINYQHTGGLDYERPVTLDLGGGNKAQRPGFFRR